MPGQAVALGPVDVAMLAGGNLIGLGRLSIRTWIVPRKLVSLRFLCSRHLCEWRR